MLEKKHSWWCLLYWEHFLQNGKIRRHHMGRCASTCRVVWSCRNAHTLSRHGHLPSSFPLVCLEWILLYYAYCTYLHIIQQLYQKAGITCCRFTLVAKGFTTVYVRQYMFLSPVWYHLEGACGMFLLSTSTTCLIVSNRTGESTTNLFYSTGGRSSRCGEM